MSETKERSLKSLGLTCSDTTLVMRLSLWRIVRTSVSLLLTASPSSEENPTENLREAAGRESNYLIHNFPLLFYQEVSNNPE